MVYWSTLCTIRVTILQQTMNVNVRRYRYLTWRVQSRKGAQEELENRVCRQIQDLHANFWHKRKKEAQRLFAKLHIPFLLHMLQRVAQFHFSSTICVRAAVSEILADFLNFHIWAWDLEFEETTQSCIRTLFLPRGVEIKLIFALRAPVFEIQADFQNFHYIWPCNLEFEARSQSCICTLFLPQGIKIKLYFALRAAVSRYGPIFKVAMFGHETWTWKKCRKLRIDHLSTPW